MIFLQIFYGTLIFLGGVAILKYRKNIYDWTGDFGWPERYLGSGGTPLVIGFFALFLMFVGVAYATGSLNDTFGVKNLGGVESEG